MRTKYVQWRIEGADYRIDSLWTLAQIMLVRTYAMPPHPSEQTRWFSEQVQPHETSLRGWLQRTFQAADVDDLVQESYARILRAQERGNIRSTKTFLFTVARNAVRDLLRRRATTRAETITETAALPVLYESPSVADVVCRRQELALLHEAVQELPERCRQVFLLRKIQGLSQREIAVRLCISENTVETLVAKGARRCADYLRARCRPAGGERGGPAACIPIR